MNPIRFSDHLQHLAAIRTAALSAADPIAAVSSNLRLSGEHLYAGAHILPVHPETSIFLIAFGKAAYPMTIAAAAQLGDKLTMGVAAVPFAPSGKLPAQVRVIPAAHPYPDEGSLAAGAAAAEILSETRQHDLVLVLVSGGGSAMFEYPLPGISLDDLRTLNGALLRSGAPIQEVNTVRSVLSLVKAGGLARLAAPARCVALIMSDVVGDRLSSIASGPTVLRPARPEAARAMLDRHNLWKSVPQSVRTALSHRQPRTSSSPRPINCLVGSNRDVVRAAQKQAEKLGFPARILTRRMQGEARQVGRVFALRLTSAARPVCLLMGGETTVNVRGKGQGGRNQEFALAASLALDGIPNVALMSLATDGVDGPTDAAGAVVIGDTAAQMRDAGLDIQASLAKNDSHTALQTCGALIHTGPTQTNLNDLVVGLSYSER